MWGGNKKYSSDNDVEFFGGGSIIPSLPTPTGSNRVLGGGGRGGYEGSRGNDELTPLELGYNRIITLLSSTPNNVSVSDFDVFPQFHLRKNKIRYRIPKEKFIMHFDGSLIEAMQVLGGE